MRCRNVSAVAHCRRPQARLRGGHRAFDCTSGLEKRPDLPEWRQWARLSHSAYDRIPPHTGCSSDQLQRAALGRSMRSRHRREGPLWCAKRTFPDRGSTNSPYTNAKARIASREQRKSASGLMHMVLKVFRNGSQISLFDDLASSPASIRAAAVSVSASVSNGSRKVTTTSPSSQAQFNGNPPDESASTGFYKRRSRSWPLEMSVNRAICGI